MADQVTRYRVFIASPGGLDAERSAVRETILKYDRDQALHDGAYFEPVGWEYVPGGRVRPQDRINEDLDRCDYFILLLWNRWGTPPGNEDDHTAGVDEEFKRAEQLLGGDTYPMKDMVVFFKGVDEQQIADPGPQLQQVLDFKARLEDEKDLFYKTFDTTADLADLVRTQLGYWIRRDHRKETGPVPGPPMPGGGPRIPPEDETELGQIEVEVDSRIKDAIGQAEKLTDEGKLTEAEAEYARLIVQTDSLDALNRYGHLLSRVGRLSQAQFMYERVRDIAEVRGDESSQAIALGNLGLVYQTRGELGRAEEMLRKALEINERLGRQEGMAAEYGNLGLIYRRRGELDQAEEMHRKSLAIEERLGRQEGMAAQYGNLGLIYQTRGELDRAEAMHRKSLAIEERLGRQEGMAAEYGNLGLIYRRRGELDKAEEMHRKSLAIEERLGHQEGMAAEYGNLGLVYEARGELDRAEEMHRKSLEIEERLGRQEGMATDYSYLGRVYKKRGDFVRAQEMFSRAQAIFERIGMAPEIAQAREDLARVELAAQEKSASPKAGRKATKKSQKKSARKAKKKVAKKAVKKSRRAKKRRR